MDFICFLVEIKASSGSKDFFFFKIWWLFVVNVKFCMSGGSLWMPENRKWYRPAWLSRAGREQYQIQLFGKICQKSGLLHESSFSVLLTLPRKWRSRDFKTKTKKILRILLLSPNVSKSKGNMLPMSCFGHMNINPHPPKWINLNSCRTYRNSWNYLKTTFNFLKEVTRVLPTFTSKEDLKITTTEVTFLSLNHTIHWENY